MSGSAEIAKAVVEELNKTRNISSEEHDKHHKWIDLQIDKEARKLEIWEQVKLHIAKYGALAVFSGLCLAIWQYIKMNLHS